MINKQLATEDLKRLQAIQTWYEPALRMYDHLLQVAKDTLIKGGYPDKNAAVNKEDWRNEMVQQYRLEYHYVKEIEQSLFRAGRIAYMGYDYIRRIGNDV